MKKLPEVEKARALMTEAIDWSVMKWMTEKKRVRQVADKANEVLDELEKQTRDAWNDELKAAYFKSGTASPDAKRLAERIKLAHDAAIQMRMDAEETFDKAERRMSTSLAREGCHKAIKGWELHLDAIKKAEAALSTQS